ncbi:MAG: prolyl oligopeptidase family serine peptidase [Bacteroidota bacterium]
MKRILLSLMIGLGCMTAGFPQNQKKPIDFKQYDSWNSLSAQKVSNNGEWVLWEVDPTKGDGKLYLQAWSEPSVKRIFNRGSQALFDPNSEYIAFRITPQADTVKKDKINKVKDEKMVKDTLAVYTLNDGLIVCYPKVKNFKVAHETSSWLAFQLEESKAEVKPEKKDSATSMEKAEDKPKKKPEFKGSPLYVIHPVSRDSQQFTLITEYGFSKHGNWLYMVSIKEDSVVSSTVRIFDTRTAAPKEIWTKDGVVKGLVSDEAGSQLAFLFSKDTAKTKIYGLYYWSDKYDHPQCVADTAIEGIPAGWSVSENGRINFSPDGRRLFFGTAETPERIVDQKDTLLADDKVSVDIWHWQDDVLQSMQVKRVEQEKKKTYQAVYHIRKNQVIQLENPEFIENYRLVRQGDVDLALGYFDKPYRWQNAINDESKADIYLTDLNTGNVQQLFVKISVSPQLSPLGNYLYWWEPADSSWYCYTIKDKITRNLTSELTVPFDNQIHDTPDEPRSYGIMGWADKDRSLYIYDQFDIWKFDPDGKEKPACVTGGYGRDHQLSIRYVSTDPEEKFIDEKKDNLFSVFHINSKKSGYFRFSVDKPDLKKLILDDCRFGELAKAKEADKLIWTRSTISEYPDLWLSDIHFGNARKVSQANPQQSDFIWAEAELLEWKDLNGEVHQGILYKPENLDPTKKYPMIVYFYERHSDGLHTHYSPRASASTVNPVEYASNGYLVFMPDIHFIIGNPGKSFYNAVMSGVFYLDKRGYVDMDHLGIQGQSWGGYGTAYIITQTDIFAAASPGAPVSNMTSAYGGIRNESGMVRQFQYEKSQSRIGGTLWDKPEYYIENSPLFFADRIHTPCLIRHDDADGAVPFSEGVQLFVALRRLGKPAWLVNYNNAPHNLSRLADKKDWSVRMMQFFNHYLKGEPAPDWMSLGVKAVDKKDSELYYWPYTQK